MLSLVMWVTWILAVPVKGSVAMQWATAQGAAGWQSALLWFAIPMIPGAVLWEMYWARHPERSRAGAVAAAVANGLLTVLLRLSPPVFWPVLFAAMGVAAAAGLAVCARRLVGAQPPGAVGRVLAITLAGITLTDWVWRWLAGMLPPAGQLGLVVLPLLLAAVADGLWRPGAGAAAEPEPPQDLRTVTWAALAIALFAVVGGASHQLGLGAGGDLAGLDVVRRLAFAGGALLAGWFLARGKLQPSTSVAATLLALSLVGAVVSFVPALLVGGLQSLAFGMLAPLPWHLMLTVLAPRTGGRWGGRGTVLFVVQCALGAGIAALLTEGTARGLGLPAAFVILVAILMLQGPVVAESAAPPDPVAVSPEPKPVGSVSATAVDLLGRFYGDRLSRRELEVGQLAIRGVSTKEIAEQLFLTPSTVKTHLKNLYRKTESANRNDLYRKLLDMDPSVEGGSTASAGAPAGAPLANLPRDAVTGLPDQTAFETVITLELSQSEVLGRPVAVILLALHGLDAPGRGAGRVEKHQALVVAASLLTTSLRSGDTVFRWKGSEFLLLLPGSGAASAREVGTRLAAKISNWAVSRGLGSHVGLGWAGTDEGAADDEALLALARSRVIPQDEVAAARQ